MIQLNAKLDASSFQKQEDVSLIKWMGRTFSLINEKLGPLSLAINLLAYCLFPLAARCVVFTSSRSFKNKCQPERIENSRQTLMALGAQSVNLKMPDGHVISAMYLDAKVCLDTLISKGAEKGSLVQSNGFVQDVLWVPQSEEFRLLMERMGLAACQNGERFYLPLGIPKDPLAFTVQEDSNPANHLKSHTPGTVIYAPGSGHLFEFRRKTIGTFLVGYGMNMLVLNYSGTGQSQGTISEQATYDNLEAAYRYLTEEKKLADEKILGYGHCMGGGPTLKIASEHPIHLLADRTFLNMGEFARLRATTVLRLPFFLHFLTSWIKPVMNKCFSYDNEERIQRVQGRVAFIEATKDELIPEDYMQQLFDRAVSAQYKVKLTMDANHDMDLVHDESTRVALGQFLADARLLGSQCL